MTIKLIFPPIVTSGFDSYYPSTAALAGYLGENGHKVEQVDLNSKVAEELLQRDNLEEFGNGNFYQNQPKEFDSTHMAAVSARLLLKNKNLLQSRNGKATLADNPSSPAYLLKTLADIFLVDLPLADTLTSIKKGSPLFHWYRKLFCKIDWASTTSGNRIIGISVPMGPQLFPALVLAQVIKQANSRNQIVLGGPTLSLMQNPKIEELLNNYKWVDAVIRYEGEVPLLRLAEQCEKDRIDFAFVPNTSYSIDGKCFHTQLVAGPNLNTLPNAIYDEEILSKLDSPELGVVVTRGCYWGKCAYCDYVELYEGSPRVRLRTPEKFVDEVEFLINKHDIRRFSLITEAITPSFALRFSKLILERGIQISWSSFAMVDKHFTQEHFKLMASSGCDHLVIGLETMNDRVLKLVDKFENSIVNESFLKLAFDSGVALKINLIPDLPTTNYQEAMESLERLKAIGHYFHSVAIFPFEATMSSKIGRNPDKYGIKIRDITGLEGQASYAENHLVILDDGMTDEERKTVIRAYKDFSDVINSSAISESTIQNNKPNSSQDTYFKIAESDFDAYESDDRVTLFNWKTRKKWDAPLGILSILKQAKTLGHKFTISQLVPDLTYKNEMIFLVDYLIDKKIFVNVNE